MSLAGTMDRLVAASAALGKVQAIAQEMADPYLISRILKRQEAVSSSSIEGINSTLDELLAVEDADEDGRSEVRQVRDYALLLDRLLPLAGERGQAIFDLGLIQRLHAEVMRSDPNYPDIPGELRGTVVWIGGQGNIAYSTWNPPPPDHVRSCILETVEYLRNEGMQSMTQNSVVRMAVAHAHFEAVHPFRDGNGRVGRLLLPLMMAAERQLPLYLSPYIDAHKDAYYAALKGAQQRLEWEAIVGFVSDAVVATVDELLVTRGALARLSEDWAGRRKFRKGAASTRALALIQNYPVLTVKRLAALLDVTVPQANQAVEQLVEAGILSERTGYARNRIFAAGEVLTVVNRPFGDEPVPPWTGATWTRMPQTGVSRPNRQHARYGPSRTHPGERDPRPAPMARPEAPDPFSSPHDMASSSRDHLACPSAAASAPRGPQPRPRTGDRLCGRRGHARLHGDAGSRHGDGRHGDGRHAVLPQEADGHARLLQGLPVNGALPREGGHGLAVRPRIAVARGRHRGDGMGRHRGLRKPFARATHRASPSLNPMPPAPAPAR